MTNERYVYIFFREDLPFEQYIVQTNHATYSLVSYYGHDEGVPNIVVIGVPDVTALHEVEKKLSSVHIPHHSWNEPDWDYGLTAITTAPIEGAKRLVLADYRVFSFAPLAQDAERPTLNREDAGANPARGTNEGGTGQPVLV